MMARKEALEKYERAKSRGLVDRDIIPLLDKINSLKDFYTTSSCSGRIVLLSIPKIGDKKDAKFLGKWHREVRYDEIKNAIGKYRDGYLFLLMQSPIIHLVAKDLQNAKYILNAALQCGFKYSSIKGIEQDTILLEILSTENMSVPVGEGGEIKVEEKELEFFLQIANQLLKRAKGKLGCFEKKINYLLLSSS